MNWSTKCKNRREIQSGQEQSRDIDFFGGGVYIHIYIIQIYMLLLLSHFSRVWLLATPWTAAHQAPPSMGFSRQEYWSGVPLPSPTTQCLLQYILFYSITVSKELNVNYIATIYKDNITGKQAKRTREEVKREVRQMPLNLESKPKSLKCCLSCLPQRSESDIVSTLNKD